METNFPFSSAKLANNTQIVSGTNQRIGSVWTLKNFLTLKQHEALGI